MSAGAPPESEHRFHQNAVFRRRSADGSHEVESEGKVRWTIEPPAVINREGVRFRYAGAQEGRLVYIESEV